MTMIKTTLICTSIALVLLTIALICHIVAMIHPRWKIYEHRQRSDKTMYIGIFRRCENHHRHTSINLNQIGRICNANKYCFHDNDKCRSLIDPNYELRPEMQSICNANNNQYKCTYSSITKGLIACTIIAVCTLAVLTICLLFIGFLFILATLILLGTTMRYDLYQYRYNLDFLLAQSPPRVSLEANVTNEVNSNYNIRLDWSSALEIIALVLSSFTLVTQIVYLISTYRNRIG
ncbi:unnamed protein product [Rotaria sordida]|uniref:Uncharacterized protein n=1 Tax=Rotaria sordida TaxID=392033 RepID=A0A815GTI6_9BILA|nr:unnamed protein product [Rotaria sordida]CAF1344704.1 unnamed protein product [Rotaria sordida]